jgi:hypothetical protein
MVGERSAEGTGEEERLETRVEELETQLAAKNNQIVVLQQALANLIRRVEALELAQKGEKENARVGEQGSETKEGGGGMKLKPSQEARRPGGREGGGSSRPSSAFDKTPRSTTTGSVQVQGQGQGRSVRASMSESESRRRTLSASQTTPLSHTTTVNKRQSLQGPGPGPGSPSLRSSRHERKTTAGSSVSSERNHHHSDTDAEPATQILWCP